MIIEKRIARTAALRQWRAAFSEWMLHRTDETEAAVETARQNYLLLL